MHKSLPIVSIPKRALVVALLGIPHVPLCDGRERSAKSRQSSRLNNPGESATHHPDERLPRDEDPPSEAERWDLPPSRELVSMRT